jgi:hypothetical protein
MARFLSVLSISFFLFLLFTNVFPLSAHSFYPPHNREAFWWTILTLSLVLIFLFRVFIITFGYRVTFISDAIKVTTILGTKTMQYSDISFYRYRLSRYIYRWPIFCEIYLVSRDSAQNVLDISLLKGPIEKTLRIPITFNTDNEFTDWIKSLPVELGERPFPFQELKM